MPILTNPFRRSKKEEKESAKIEGETVQNRTFLKAMPLRDFSDVETVKSEIRSGNIIILRVTPLASKSIDDVKRAVNELCEFAESVGGDIARLGEERVVICPAHVKIWREKVSISSEPITTAA